MRLLVTGGRDFTDRPFAFKILDKIHTRRPITLLIEGGAAGADRFGREWARARGVPFRTCEANWERYGNHAGRVRNCQMLREEKPQFVAAFRGRDGTRHMCRIAREAGVPVFESWSHGSGDD